MTLMLIASLTSIAPKDQKEEARVGKISLVEEIPPSFLRSQKIPFRFQN